MNKPFDLAMSVLGSLGLLAVGWLWSSSTWRHGFDMGWLVVAFAVIRTISVRFEARGEQGARSLNAWWPVLPAFVLEGLSNYSLHQFSVSGGSGWMVAFSVFSCLLLIVIAAATALLRFGVGISEISQWDDSILCSVVRGLALAVSVAASIGTLILLIRDGQDPQVQLASLQSWFYMVSLVVFFILTVKTMLPLILQRFRASSD